LIKEFGSGIHFTLQHRETMMRILDLPIMMAMDMGVIPSNGHQSPNSLHQIQVLILRVWQAFRFAWPKGVNVNDANLCN